MKISVPRLRKVMTQIAEKKCFTSPVVTVGVPAVTWTFDSFLDGIQQGTALGQRIGNQITLKAIHVFIQMVPYAPAAVAAGAAVATGGICRMALYHNKEAVGALPSGSMMTFNDYTGVVLYQQKPRLTLVKERQCHFVITSQGATQSTAGPAMQVRMSIYPKTKIDYVSNAGTASDLIKHDYGMGIVANNANVCTMQYYFMVEFTDQ